MTVTLLVRGDTYRKLKGVKMHKLSLLSCKFSFMQLHHRYSLIWNHESFSIPQKGSTLFLFTKMMNYIRRSEIYVYFQEATLQKLCNCETDCMNRNRNEHNERLELRHWNHNTIQSKYVHKPQGTRTMIIIIRVNRYNIIITAE